MAGCSAEFYERSYFPSEELQEYDDYYAPHVSDFDPVPMHDLTGRPQYTLPPPTRPYRSFGYYCPSYASGYLQASNEHRVAEFYNYETEPVQHFPDASQDPTNHYRQGSPSETDSSSTSGHGFNCSRLGGEPHYSDSDSGYTPLTQSTSHLFIGSSPSLSFKTVQPEVTWSDSCISPREIQLQFANHQDDQHAYDEFDEMHTARVLFPQEPAFDELDDTRDDLQKQRFEDTRTCFERNNNEERGSASPISDDGADSDYSESQKQRRRSRMARSPTDRALNLKSKSRVVKRGSKVHSSAQARSSRKSDSQTSSCSSLSAGNKKGERGSRYFTCPLKPYGCKHSFEHKNEWKRHFNFQHLCRGFWRCDQCLDSDTRPNDFNRKDLFTQHLRRMHSGFPSGEYYFNGTKLSYGNPLSARRKPPASKSTKSKDRTGPSEADIEAFEGSLPAVRERCWTEVRRSPTLLFCLFCEKNFNVRDWKCDEWLEHVGKHLQMQSKGGAAGSKDIAETNGDVQDLPNWAADTVLRDWLLQEGLIQRDPQTGALCMVDKSSVHRPAVHRRHSSNVVIGEPDAEGEVE